MRRQKSLVTYLNRTSIIVALTAFVLVSAVNIIYAQNNTLKNNVTPSEDFRSEVVDAVVQETIAIVASILGLGITALLQWIRTRGVPMTDEQEIMFRDIVTNRFEKLAKDSWTTMREHPEKLSIYWEDLREGHVPEEFQKALKDEGYKFAMDLKKNKQFRDFAANLTDSAMQELLKDLRTNLKNDYQKEMLDVIPKITSIAVDSAFDPDVSDVESWSKRALENLKPLLLSTEATDNEKNLMIIIKSEINKRLQERLGVK